MNLNNYSTHIPILEYVLNNIENKNTIFEYGMGFYSTPLLSEKVDKVLFSVEMQDENWYKQIKNSNKLKNNVELYCMLGKDDAIEFFKNLQIKFDLIFVDGHGESRWKCINEAFGKCDIIITHDTETSSYNWHLVNLPNDYIWLDIKTYNPWTSVITNNKDLISKLSKEFNATIREFQKHF